MVGTVVLVTGASSGIGRATAAGLLALGARVAIAGRDAERTAATARDLGAAGGAAGPVEMFVADLSSMAEVRRVAGEVQDRLPRLDVLVNNAGGYWHTRRVTADGLERTFATNHLAPFLLTNLLLDRLREAPHGRVVTVASGAHALGRIDFDDLQGERAYSGARAYNQSKLANVLFTAELARRLAGTTVSANALHPGMVRTGFGAGDPGTVQRLLVPFLRPFLRSPAKGAETSIHLASSPAVDGVSGGYFAGRRPRRPSAAARDEAVAVRLWQVSAGLAGLRA